MAIMEQEQFQAWRDNPLTQEFLGLVRKRQQELTAAWGRGLPLSPEQQAQAVLLGQLAGISFDHEPENDRYGIFEMFGQERPEEVNP